MRTETKRVGAFTEYRATFDSVMELAEQAKAATHDNPDKHGRDWISFAKVGRDWSGLRHSNEALTLARDGWTEHLAETLELVEHAVSKVEREDTFPAFLPAFDVSGAEVDVARYLDDEPECMIDYPLTEIVKAGKVITLCASVAYSGAIDSEDIIARGRVIAALALALERCGYGCEIWTDATMAEDLGRKGDRISARTMVKGARDVLDEAKILYALAHPSMLRVLSFAAWRIPAPKATYERIAGGWKLGYPAPPTQDLPEGTIYLPEVMSGESRKDLDSEIEQHLRDLGIIG